MKILVCGDTHMDTSSICNVAIPKARKNDCNLIIQVGDLGYWEHVDRGRIFLNKVSKCLVRENITMLWIDGNHENHPLLWEKYPELQLGRDLHDDPRLFHYLGLSKIRPNLFYVPRGHVMKIDHVNCLFMGGAWSIDKDWRIQEELIYNTPGTLWWSTETITHTEVERAIRHIERSGPIDLMFSHDVPTGINVPGIHAEGKKDFPESMENRVKLREVFDAAQPKMLVHGHYHERYTGKLPLKPKVGEGDLLDWDYCRVDGLNCNGQNGFAVILDLDSLFVSDE